MGFSFHCRVLIPSAKPKVGKKSSAEQKDFILFLCRDAVPSAKPKVGKNRAQTKSEGPFSGSLLVAEEVTDPTPLPLPLKGGESVRSSFVRETQQRRTIARLVLSLRNTFTRNAQLSPPFKGRGKGVGSVTFSSSRNAHHPSPLSSPTTPHKKILREKIFCGGFP